MSRREQRFLGIKYVWAKTKDFQHFKKLDRLSSINYHSLLTKDLYLPVMTQKRFSPCWPVNSTSSHSSKQIWQMVVIITFMFSCAFLCVFTVVDGKLIQTSHSFAHLKISSCPWSLALQLYPKIAQMHLDIPQKLHCNKPLIIQCVMEWESITHI